MLSKGPVSYLKFVDRKLLRPVRSEALTRVTLPATGSPPWFARNVVSGRVSLWLSQL